MILVKAPARVRIDVMSPFGPTYTVAVDGSHLHAYDRGEKVLYVGSATAANLQRYTRVALDASVLGSLIRGLPPLPLGEVKVGTVRPGTAGWTWQAELAGGGTIVVDLERESLRPVHAEMVAPAFGGKLSVDFDRYQDVDGVAVAHRVRARLVDGSAVDLQYSRIWREVGMDESAFTIAAPAGVRVLGMSRETLRGTPF